MASPCTHSHPEESAEGIPDLLKARIFQLCRDNAAAVSPPIPPVAPRTRAVRSDFDMFFSIPTVAIQIYLSMIDLLGDKTDADFF
jgi:hypothetical protein